jgi:hypothetical protein
VRSKEDFDHARNDDVNPIWWVSYFCHLLTIIEIFEESIFLE